MQTEAAAYERRLTTDKEIEWISLANDGDVLALCELFSRDLVSLTLWVRHMCCLRRAYAPFLVELHA